MSKQTLNLGTIADDHTGDTLRVGGGKINSNFTELYTFTNSIKNVLLTDNGPLVADGVTNNTPLLQALVDAASNDDIIYFPKGNYFFSTKVTVTKRLHFRGDGKYASMLKTTANVTILEWNGSSCNYSTMFMLGFQGNDTGASQNGLVVTGVSQWNIDQSSFKDFSGAGATLSGNSISPYFNNTISNCDCSDNSGTGISTTGQYITIDNCAMDNCGVGYNGANANISIIGGSADGCSTRGIRLVSATDNGKVTIIGTRANHTSIEFGDCISPIHFYGNCAASSLVINNCQNVVLNGYFPGPAITNQPAGSCVTVEGICSGAGSFTSLNATAKILIHNNQFATSPTPTVDGTGIIIHYNNHNNTGTPVAFNRFSSGMYWADVSITNAQMLAIRATPITLVAAFGAGQMIEFIRGEIAFDYNTAYTESNDNLQILYGSGGVAASEVIETTGLLDATADTMIQVLPNGTSTARAKAAVDNVALVIQNIGDGEFGGGNSANVVRVRVLYRIIALGW